MYKNVLLDNLKIIDFLQKNNINLRSKDLMSLSDDKLKLLADNLNDRMKHIIRYQSLNELMNEPSILKKILDDDSGIYVKLIDDSSDIDEIKELVNIDISLIQAVYKNYNSYYRISRYAFNEISAKEVLLYCVNNNITDITMAERISEFAEKYNSMYSFISRKDFIEILDFVVKYECFDFEISEIQSLSLMNSSSAYREDVKKILEELIPINKLGLQIKLIEIINLPDIFEKVKLLKEIILYVTEKEKTGVKLIEKEEQNITYKTSIFENIKDKDLENVVYITGVLLQNNFSTKEMYTFLYKLKEGNTFIIPREHNERLSKILSYIYPNYKSLEHIKDNFKFKHYILSNKKTKLINTLAEMDDYEFKGGLFSDIVFKKLNLNNLTQKEIINIDTIHAMRYIELLDLNQYSNIEYAQFMEMQKFTLMQARIFNKLTYDTLSKKLDILKNFSGTLNLEYINEEYNVTLSDLLELFEKKSLKERVYEIIDPQKVRFSSITTTKWIELLLLDCSNDLKEQIKSSEDIDFIAKRLTLIKESPIKNLEELKRTFFKSSDELTEFINNLELSDDFVSANFESIYNFYNRGCIAIYNKYMSGIYSSTIKRNFNNITKAELLGRLEQVKFYPGDLSLEVNMDIDNKLEEKWKENISLNINDYTLVEDYSYETCMKIGEEPVSTCLSYIDGPYKSCLLSSFDSTLR